MAPATTSPIKILSDLGYEVWEMESDADMLSALVSAVNSLSSLNAKDGRILILQDAIKEIRGASRAASPSKGMKVTEKKRTLKGSKFIPKAKPTAKPKTKTAALLPAAKDDNAPIFSTLLNGLKNIASLLKNISTLLGVQLTFKRLLDARQRRRDALEAKRKREEGLEGSEKSGMGTKISSAIAKPMKSLWANLLNFFKNILLGSAVLGFYKWMKDPKNLETIKGIADWFSKHGKKVLIGIVSILGLRLGFRLYRLYQGIKRLVNLFRNLGKKPKPRLPGEQATNIVKSNAQKRREALIKSRERRRSFATKRTQSNINTAKAGETVKYSNEEPVVVGKSKTAGQIAEDIGVGKKTLEPNFRRGIDPADISKGEVPNTPSNINRAFSGDIDVEKIFGLESRTPIDMGAGAGRLSITDSNFEMLKRVVSGEVSPETVDSMIKSNRSFKLDPAFVENIITPKINTNLTPIQRLGMKFDDMMSGFRSGFVEMLEKAGMSKPAISTGGKIVQHSLPFVGAAFDFLAMMDNFDKGNYTAATLFAIGGAASALSGLALSSGAFAPAAVPLSAVSAAASIFGMLAQVIETGVKNRVEDPNFQMGRKPPNPQAKFKKYTVDPDKNYITPRSRRRNKSINLSGNNKTLSSGSGATSSDVASVGTTHLEHLSHIKGVERDLNLSLA